MVQTCIHISPCLEFLCSKADSSLFVFKSSYGILLMLIFIDDIIVTGSNSSKITCLIHLCGKAFSLNDLGKLHNFLVSKLFIKIIGYF